MLLASIGAIAWFAPPEALVVLAAVVAVLGFLEFAQLLDALGAPVPRLPGAVAAAAVTVAAAWPGVPLEPVLVAVVVVAAGITVASGRPDRAGLAGMAATVAAPVYLGLPLGGLAGVRWTEGREAAMLVLLAIVVSDTCQYYAGRLFGRRPLAPTISPKKTVEGAIGGLVGGTLLIAVLGEWWLPGTPPAARVLLGLAVAALGIVGDLFESALKRAAAVKDSSHLIPGHGGVLDRIDALLLASPVYVAVLRYGPWRMS
jgi:phosphatidate cytidylyltransferase